MKKITGSFLLSLVTFVAGSAAYGNDYILATYEAVPSIGLTITPRLPKTCRQLFTGIKNNLSVRIQRVASYSQDANGNRDDNARGFHKTEKNLAEFDKITDEVLHRILGDWRHQNGFSPDEIVSIYNLHQRLSRKRTKFLTVESTDHTLFSGLRIYDSSLGMKDHGQPWSVEDEGEDRKEIAERVFRGFDLDQLFTRLGKKRETHTWSLGLLDISGPQEKALQTLLAQAADFLDVHYNNRSFFNYGKLKPIEADDVDIIFYSNSRLKQYYQRVLKTDPVRNENGEEIIFTPKSAGNGTPGEFYVFHLKGSEFIQRFFKIEYQEPMFASSKAFRNHQELYQFIRSKIQPQYDRLNPEQYQAKNLADLLRRLRAITYPIVAGMNMGVPPSEDQYWFAIAQTFRLRDQLPPDLFENWRSPDVIKELREIISSPLGRAMIGPSQQQVAVGDMLNLTVLAMIGSYMDDPMTFLMNRMHKR